MGNIAISLYLCLTYIPQFFFYIFLQDKFHDRYHITTLGAIHTLIVCLALLFYFLFFKTSTEGHSGTSKKIRIGPSIQALIGLVYFLLSLYFFLSYDSTFRHSQRVSESGILVLLLYITKPFAILLIYLYITKSISSHLKGFERLICLLLSISFALSSTGTLFLPLILLPLILALNLKSISNIRLRFWTTLKVSPLLLLCGAGTIIFGLSLKIGLENSLDLFKNDTSDYVTTTVILRASSSFVSASNQAAELFYGDQRTSDIISGQISTLKYRLSGLLGIKISGGSYLANLNRINYEAINKYPDLVRAGTSPGLIASFLYLKMPIVNLILLFLYCRLIASRINKATPIQDKKGPHLLLIVGALYLILPLFESPFSIISILDPVFVTLMALLLLPRLKIK